MPTDLEMLTDQLKLVEALHHIASESTDGDIVRYAMGALISTDAGQAYLSQNPVIV